METFFFRNTLFSVVCFLLLLLCFCFFCPGTGIVSQSCQPAWQWGIPEVTCWCPNLPILQMGKLRLKKYKGLVCSKVSGLASERSRFRSLPGHLLQVISSSCLTFVVRMVPALQGSAKESFDKGLGPEATEGSSEISLRGFSTGIPSLSKVFWKDRPKPTWPGFLRTLVK